MLGILWSVSRRPLSGSVFVRIGGAVVASFFWGDVY